MKIEVKTGTASGVIDAPPSKSCAHRLLICAALAEGVSTVSGVSFCEDILATLDCIKALGASYEISDNIITVHGCGGNVKGGVFPCRESGSTLRFLMPISRLSSETSDFYGTERLISRGVGVYEEILGGCGIEFVKAPTFITLRGQLSGGSYKIKGNVSSQFISGMLFALPLTRIDSIIEVTPPFESRSYVGITVDALEKFGVKVYEKNENEFRICGGQMYRSSDTVVEGDWSNAAFLYALNCFGGNVDVRGLNPQSRQGDRVCLKLLEKIRDGYTEADLSDCPDLAPILFAAAAACHGARFTGTKRLAIKESDRAAAMAEELSKFGVTVRLSENSVEITGGELEKPTEVICGHNDHRIVMALCVLATLTGAVIDGAEAVNKSYPNFFDALRLLGLEVLNEA